MLFDGDEVPSICHVTWKMAYETATGWVTATPVPDLWAAAPAGAA
ncbi:hypothetical protein ABZZ47_43145 [Streptomyces sp. NPDC006465]